MNDLLRSAIASRVGNLAQRLPGGVPGNLPIQGGPANPNMLGPGLPMKAPGIPLQAPGGLPMRAPGVPLQETPSFDVGRMADPRGMQGILSRGKNVYGGGSFSSRGSGRPSTGGGNVPRGAIARRLGR